MALNAYPDPPREHIEPLYNADGTVGAHALHGDYLTYVYCNQSSQRAVQAGFTLVEAITAMGLMMVVIAALYGGVTFGIRQATQSPEEMRAVQIMLDKMEALRLYRWDQFGAVYETEEPDDPSEPFDSDDPHDDDEEAEVFVVPTTFTAPFDSSDGGIGQMTYHGQLIVTNAPISESYSNNLLLVTVSLTWTNRGQVYTRSMETLFAKYGMQNSTAD